MSRLLPLTYLLVLGCVAPPPPAPVPAAQAPAAEPSAPRSASAAAAADASGYAAVSPFATTRRLSDAGQQEAVDYIRTHGTCKTGSAALDPSDGGKPGRPEVFASGSRDGGTPVNGRLPPEVIQRIVRGEYGKFRACYEDGLRRDPNLQGRVTVRFVIGRDGTVTHVSNGGSDLPDALVVQCIIRAYSDLCFPQPEGGIVTVFYPIMFSPGD